ncbi:dehydrogenase/reductase SDR family member 11-like [Maylandia zebra]|uniref:dehydrogenase/reductase SDR family member 11-like n=1 Tax=Maylandia zebra TaxID=106582 RepID=UPI00403C370D
MTATIKTESISPGLVATEFISRASSKNPEEVAALYATTKSLKTKDIASAVTYVLSALPHVQIGELLVEPIQHVSCCPSNPRTRLVFTLKCFLQVATR